MLRITGVRNNILSVRDNIGVRGVPGGRDLREGGSWQGEVMGGEPLGRGLGGRGR